MATTRLVLAPLGEGQELLLEVAGSLTFDQADYWRQVVATAWHIGPRRLLVDLSRTTYLDTSEEGYYTGSPLLDLLAWMRATHGSLHRTQSLGMVLSTDPALLASPGPVHRQESPWTH